MNNPYILSDCSQPNLNGANFTSKIIAVKADATKQMHNNYNEGLKKQATQSEQIIKDSTETLVEEIPVFEQPQEMVVDQAPVAGVNFQAPPAELSNVPLENPTPVSDVNPIQIDIPNANEPKDLNQQVSTPIETAAFNILSDEEAIKELKNLLDRMGITSEVIRTQFVLNFELNLNQYKLVKYIEDQKVENADIAKTAAEISKVNQQLANANNQQQTITPINNAPQGGPILNYQQPNSTTSQVA